MAKKSQEKKQLRDDTIENGCEEYDDDAEMENSDYNFQNSDSKLQNSDANLQTNCPNECECNKMMFSVGDAVFASVVVAPLVVTHWRGTWELMDLHHLYFPYAQSFILGMTVHICFTLIRSNLFARSTGAWSDGAGRWLYERVICRIYTYVFIICCLMHWRGGWGLFDQLIHTILPDENDPHRPYLIMCFVILMYASLVALRSARNLLAPPYFLVTDGKEPTYTYTTRFKQTNSRETILYVLDCIFSVAIVGSLVILLWRGLWALLDIYLYPEDKVKSLFISLVVGYSLVTITFSLQVPLRWAVARLHGAPRLLLADAYHLLSFVATINLWRAIWGLLDVYLFPDSPKLSNWLSHGVSLIFLMLLNCSNSILVRGVYIDAEEPAGECVVFPCHYLRLFFHRERTKKRHRRAIAAAAAASAKLAEDPALAPLQLAIVQEKV